MLYGYDTALGGSAYSIGSRQQGLRNIVGIDSGMVRRGVSLHRRRDSVQSASKGEECRNTHDTQ